MSEVTGADKSRLRRRTRWFAMGILLLALLPPVGIVLARYDLDLPLFLVRSLRPGYDAAGLALLALVLAVIALLDSARLRDRLPVVLCGLGIMTSISYLVFLGRGVERAGRNAEAVTGLVQIKDGLYAFFLETGRVPSSVEELVDAGILQGDAKSWARKFVLAPLDTAFCYGPFSHKIQDEVLVAYCTDYPDASKEWLCLHYSRGTAPVLPSSEVLQWVADQREAITWLDESFALADLERIAQTASGRRGRMASAILGYRREKAAEEARESQKQGP